MFRFIFLFLFITSSYAQSSALFEVTNLSLEDFGNRRIIGLPYMFFTEATELSYGAVVVSRGYGQKDLAIVGTGYTSENKSYGYVVGVYNYHIKNISNKLFIDYQINSNKKNNDLVYLNSNKQNSAENTNSIKGVSRNRKTIVKANYTLSVKNKKGQIELPEFFEKYVYSFKTGAKKLGLSYFDEFMDFDEFDGDNYYGRSKGFIINFEHDVRDIQGTPSKGFRSFVNLAHDFGSDSRSKYTKLEFDHSKYFKIPNFSFTTLQVIALNAFYSTMLDYDESNPPAWFAQANLGGSKRLRGYRQSRFYGKNALYGSVEYRTRPKLNIFKQIPIIDKIDIPWWQLVVFGEVGNVNNQKNFDLRIPSTYYSYGFGLSAMVEGLVARSDLAFGEDTYYIRFFVNQSF
ncbi:hypothetical protein [Halobacteriovorax sp. HLS]|uniref:hypothetical protein n=1 Tax=Halobacteriovorax sp. HLS TaxID=2234000 RepID=UPI000FDB07FE|nr:hypothetical protein [Halobacteriovorax sp. HLS]